MWEHKDTFEGVKIARSRDTGLTILIDGPDELFKLMDSSFFDDEQHTGAPTDAGFFTCTVELWFSQGYSEGYQDDRENEIEFRIVGLQPVAGVADAAVAGVLEARGWISQRIALNDLAKAYGAILRYPNQG